MKSKLTPVKSLSLKFFCLFAAILLALSLQWEDSKAHRYDSRVTLAGYSTDIRVWMEDDIDVYPCEEDIVFYVRASSDCYATVYMVDTEGFLHVIYPFSPEDEAFIRGGVVYRFTPAASGIFYSSYPRGIAYVFAVASPDPFIYSAYGAGIFGGSGYYRIYGDPFVACKRFYLSIIPQWTVLASVSISFSHFYLREWVRFPRYLCHHYGSAGYCWDPWCSEFITTRRIYREHHYNPYRVLRPSSPLPTMAKNYARIVRSKRGHERQMRKSSIRETARVGTRSGDRASNVGLSKKIKRMKSSSASRPVAKRALASSTRSKAGKKAALDRSNHRSISRGKASKQAYGKAGRRAPVSKQSIKSSSSRISSKSKIVTRNNAKSAKRSHHKSKISNGKTSKHSKSVAKRTRR